jgi:putative spermidine/putrescine transport system permease protein
VGGSLLDARGYCDPQRQAAGNGIAHGGLAIKLSPTSVSYLQVSPLLVVLIAFFGIPLLMIISVSFFEFDGISSVPAFQFGNYVELFTSRITLTLYLKTIEYALIVWAITLLIGFTVSYYLAFHIRSILWQMALFLLCTVPFWTSNIIRMISWIPFLGRNGLFNQALMALGVTDKPLEFLLFSDFAVIVAYVHLFTLFMIVPIFNSMARIDRSIVEAALDGGSSRWRIIWEIIIPLSKTGIALGSIFVITLVMGDFYVVNTMSGGHSASVVLAMYNQIAAVQYPWAAASAVLLLVIVTLMVAAILRLVDVRRELSR